jgi:hypothetical protein
MQSVNRKDAVNNPVINSLFVINDNEPANIVPGNQKFICTEDFINICTEDGKDLITES